MTKIRVLHIVTALSWRGGEQQAAYLLNELRAQVNAFVLCSKNSQMESFCEKNGHAYFTQKKKGGVDLAYAKRIKQICVQNKIELIHLHDAHAHTFAILAASLFGNKTPLVLSRRVDFPIKNSFFSRFKYNHPAIKRILCVSDTIKKITAKGIKDESKLYTVYSGIDLKKFSLRSNRLRNELNLQDTAFLIGNTSALADHKDYFTFLDVAEVVIRKNNDVQFVIMGDGPMREEIHNYAKSKELNGQLTFMGFRNDVEMVLADLDLFLITSKTEGLGTSILDAFACKVPVVGTNGGGIAELVENEKTGLLCEVKNKAEIVKAIQKMIDEPELSKRMAENAFEKVQQFSKEETAVKTLEHYTLVLARNS